MHHRDDLFDVSILNEPNDSSEAPTYSHAYDRVIDLSGGFRPTSQHGVICRHLTGASDSVLVLAGGGGTGVHDHSAVVFGDVCYLAVGDAICLLTLPQLNLNWNAKVDAATCFGVYYSKDHKCLLSHGELEIACLSLDGALIWSRGGAGIFTGDFQIVGECVQVVDFNGVRYRFDIARAREH